MTVDALAGGSDTMIDCTNKVANLTLCKATYKIDYVVLLFTMRILKMFHFYIFVDLQ